ncbi:MAG: EamA family transporter [Anaerolineaceae bacterium]|nr:EamA family transporter [Anaerolineaceae bacterium]
MFYISALLAIFGAIGYQYFVKHIPESINPIVSLIGMYIAVLIISSILLLFFPPEGGISSHIRQLNWIQLALAGSVILIELGYLLMYRYGWNLSTGNLITGVFINIILVTLGVALLGEKLRMVNLFGIVLSIIGVTLVSYRP